MPGNDVLLDLFAHNAWANLQVLDFCAALSPEQLAVTDSATYGDVVSTLQHLVGSEAFYWSMFSGTLPGWSRPDSEAATIEEITAWAQEIGPSWQELLSDPLPLVARRTRSDGTVAEMPVGVVLTQTIHHGNVHREQVSHMLTALGLQPPDISGWRYAREGKS